MYLLLKAEHTRVINPLHLAEALYDQALLQARASGFIQIVALTHELKARYHTRRGQTEKSQLHLEIAYQRYREWGANTIAERLALEFPWLHPNAVTIDPLGDLVETETDSPEKWIATQFARAVAPLPGNCRITYFRLSKTLVLDFASSDLMIAAWRGHAHRIVKAAKAIENLVQRLKLTSPEVSWKPFSISKLTDL